ncbi:hypothetical protein BTA51_06825 [Hahella sp. CCB-MM4]|uniref:DUF1513 domain-containing protein n=1 Tax=Hahella sp. (strain CCB-MM4) TaxID=1926491 RepID=UPI000BDA5B0C|nr:DUF1513 domain-containing protein [Hahella sp. CCB-MM4]OZG74689.1 hypothetical protein BTA51_06825 [Hahella sp. CCB-MM4]
MQVTRRQLLQAGLLATAGLVIPALGRTADNSKENLLLSSVTDKDDKNWWVLSDSQGNILAQHLLPGRGHGSARHPSGKSAVIVGRRPATFMSVVEVSPQGEYKFTDLTSATGRHFFGHAVYSVDGKFIYTTENDFDNGRGVIVVRDISNDYKVIAEWESGGIGPHELRMMPDGHTLVIANGGILTRPDQPREKLNLDTMKPNLAYLDTRTGEMLSKHELPDHQLSIRHIDVADTGRVWIGCQYEGMALDPMPLVYHHDLNQGGLQAAEASMDTWRALKHYTGSVVADNQQGIIGISSPRGDRVTFWDNQSGKHLQDIKLRDVCGLIPSPNGKQFVATTGKGDIAIIDAQTLAVTSESRTPELHWDNHLQVLA